MLLLLTSTPSLAPTSAQALGEEKPVKPAEEVRLSTSAFRAGLKKRGLTELLDLHLREFPPAGKTAALLMRRDLKLTEFADSTRSTSQRRAAVAEANRLLQEVIEENPSDRRRFDWRFTLSHSLIYDEAEPFFTSILYRGGTDEDRRRLGVRTTSALATLASLKEQIAAEYERIDNLSVRQFERLERSGRVDRLDRLAPRAQYLTLWALLYDSIRRSDTDPVRAKHLHDIVGLLEENGAILDSPHHMSRVQVQALLLAGMTHRLLNDHASARSYLDRALDVADRLDTVAESERIRWAVTLAMIERIRNDRDDGRFERAMHRIALFRSFVEARTDDPFPLALVASLLERSVFGAHALATERDGNSNAARRLRHKAWIPLANLVRQYTHRKDEIYATLYDVIGPDADPATLDPFEQCALVAGLLFDADRENDEVDRRLDRAIEVGERFVSEVPQAAGVLVPEVLYNVAVAQYRRGRTLEAARRFLEVARDHSRFESASQAATFAVQLASALYEDPTLHEEPEVRQLYREALETLLGHHAGTDAAIYWRFYYAQLLDEQGAYAAAAAEYALVVAEHEHYLQAVLLSLRCTVRVIESESRKDSPDLSDLRRRARGFADVQRRLIGLLATATARETDPDRVAMLHGMAARARLLSAEVEIMSTIDRPERALETLVDFEKEHPDLTRLAGRVWRVRLVAYERLGRLDEAARAIPAY
ncbi:MAG: hypothetical protein IIB60_01990, partial [Planctomycetes bacterium]|nr:hypothetical protein [Planctomycetota bacterium]